MITGTLQRSHPRSVVARMLLRRFSSSPQAYVLIAVVTVMLWGSTIAFDFVWDDQYFIVELESIRSLKNVPMMFTSLEAQAARAEEFKVFRPLRTMHYALCVALAGGRLQPWIFHLSNVLWHAVATMLLYGVTCLLLRDTRTEKTRKNARPCLHLSPASPLRCIPSCPRPCAGPRVSTILWRGYPRSRHSARSCCLNNAPHSVVGCTCGFYSQCTQKSPRCPSVYWPQSWSLRATRNR